MPLWPNLKEASLGFAVSLFPQESCASLGLVRSWSSSGWRDGIREWDTECPAPFLVSLLAAPEVGWVVFYPRDALATSGGRTRGERLLWGEPGLVAAVQQGGAGGGEHPREDVASAALRHMALRWEPKTLVFPELKGKRSHPVPVSPSSLHLTQALTLPAPLPCTRKGPVEVDGFPALPTSRCNSRSCSGSSSTLWAEPPLSRGGSGGTCSPPPG